MHKSSDQIGDSSDADPDWVVGSNQLLGHLGWGSLEGPYFQSASGQPAAWLDQYFDGQDSDGLSFKGLASNTVIVGKMILIIGVSPWVVVMTK